MTPGTIKPTTGLAAASALVASLALLFGSCSKQVDSRPPRRPSPPPPGHNFLSASALGGHWQWSHIEESDGVRRVEDEHWYLKLVADTVSGHYRRVVTFLSLDGVPFECSQSLVYRLVTDYRLMGTADADNLSLGEVRYRVEPSPCERGFRRLADYRGELRGGQLVLHWPGGSQVLTRGPAPPAVPAAPTLTGSWVWRNRQREQSSSEVRVENESWQLSESAHGTITGSYLRTVTVFDRAGRSYPCAGASQYQYRDRYTVVGTRRGKQLVLSESAVDIDPQPCVNHDQRHLDTATGEVGGDFIELVWRGRRHQVLHRVAAPAPDRAQARAQ